jgi:hypothetical protein
MGLLMCAGSKASAPASQVIDSAIFCRAKPVSACHSKAGLHDIRCRLCMAERPQCCCGSSPVSDQILMALSIPADTN